MWYIIAELLKLIGTAVATTVAIYSVYNKRRINLSTAIRGRKLSKKARFVIRMALLGFVLSGGAQLFQLINTQISAESNRKQNTETANRLAALPSLIENSVNITREETRKINESIINNSRIATTVVNRLELLPRKYLRSSYPLEPVELIFDIEYSMKDKNIEPYALRLKNNIIQMSLDFDPKQDKNILLEKLDTTPVLISINSIPGWKPNDQSNEFGASSYLLHDDSTFYFSGASTELEDQLHFMSTDPANENKLLHYARKDKVTQKFQLFADFRSKKFIKRVICTNPIRLGNDVKTISPIDLIGTKITWRIDNNGKLKSFSMRFSYEFGFGQQVFEMPFGRQILINNESTILLNENNLGLKGIFN